MFSHFFGRNCLAGINLCDCFSNFSQAFRRKKMTEILWFSNCLLQDIRYKTINIGEAIRCRLP